MQSVYADSEPSILLEELADTGIGLSSRVILFNDEIHTFEEVAIQIARATSCTMNHAEDLTWEVHTRGMATVFAGSLEDSLRVSSVLEEIFLQTQIDC